MNLQVPSSLAAACLLASACSSSGTNFDVAAATSVSVGMTRTFVVQTLGSEPASTSPVEAASPLASEGCKQLATWSFAEYTGGVMYVRSVVVPFDDAGRVCSKPAVIDVDSR